MGTLTIILPLIALIYEDFKYRAIHWTWVVLLLILVLVFYPLKLNTLLFNTFILIVQLAGITLYFSIKKRQFVNIINKQLGVGDIVFFIPLLFLFSSLNLLTFFTISIFLSLAGYLIVTSIIQTNTHSIPLAGCMSIGLALTIVYSYVTGFNLQNDTWILKIIAKIPLI